MPVSQTEQLVLLHLRGLTAGTYEVTVTDSNGCTSSVSDIHIEEPEALTIKVATKENISCAGAANGSVTVNAAGGAFPYTYKWSKNAGDATTQRISGLAGGTYSVEVTDNNNCTFTLEDILISEPSALVATAGSQIDVSCNGGTNGSATVHITGGVSPYTYTWSPSGGNEATATGLSIGNYVVTVQDANLCTTKQDFTISQPLFALSATTTQNNVSCNGGNNGSATVNVTGGTGDYTYLWLPAGGTGATATGLTDGIYTVTITDANLCTITRSVTITTITDVIVPVPDVIVPVPDVTNLPNITNYCAVLATDIAIPTATDNCNGVINATTNDPLSYTTEGSYTITWKYTDASNNNTTQTQTINVIASPLKQVSFSNKEFSYDGNPHAIQIDNLPAGATVTYTTTPATGSANSATNSGTYTVTATITPAWQMSNCTPIVLTAEIKINKAAQQITFDDLPTKNIGKDNSFQLEGKSNSGLPVSYTFNYTSALAPATISSSGLVTLLQSGEITIVAHQDGNDNYLSANTVSQILVITNGSASIAQITIGNQSFENPQQQINHLLDCGQSNPTITIQTENNSSLVFPASTFTIQTPKVGVYKQDVTVTSQDGTISKNYVIIVERRFNFFDIVQQKFNNVLLVNNNPQTNGGYEFVSYKWFKDGQLISTGQSYSAGNNITDTLDATANYSVKMTTKDGLVLQTCSAVIQKLNSFQAKLYPNPIQAGQTITIDADYSVQELEKMHISIYSISGSLIQTIESSTAKTQMQLPPSLQNGTYIVILETSDTKKSFKVIVNK
ncbi:T9SS type A sorting domain-containing protein [Flavobacterium sp. NPDC079362]|uniref:T9SS type A sorting domain-containing protein n=1 Tax=Flavobacterium sp. NPDC079362 TaxID=3390566 RepID=UPI003CFDFB51